VKAGDQVGRWRLLFSARNAAGTRIWVGQCKCLSHRELRESDLTRRSRCWSCGHQPTSRPRAKTGRSSRFRGVTFDAFTPLKKPWRVAIHVHGVHCFIGRFASESEAARAHDKAARVLLGPKPILNFPGEGACDARD
jgi:hypothetical protein